MEPIIEMVPRGLALLWMAIVAVLLARLCGGLILVARLRRRAMRVEDSALRDSVRRVAARLGVTRPVWLFESPDLGAPIASGLRRPALILPLGLRQRASHTLLEALIAHELEHIRGRHQAVAVLQALVDALVFYCPGARWLSAETLLAREQSCDDVAVHLCGNPKAYAAALGMLVGAVDKGPALALGATAPSLVARIRRVLEGETMLVRSRLKMTALVGALLIMASAGIALAGAAFIDTAARAERENAFATRLPSGHLTPPGAPVAIISVAPSATNQIQTVRVRNICEDRVTAVTFVAVVELIAESGPQPPARFVRSAAVPTSLEPGQAAELRPAFLSISDLLQWQRDAKSAGQIEVRAQPVLAVASVERAGSGEWSVTLKAGARNALEAFYLQPFVSMALLGRKARTVGGICIDDRGFEYSEGAVVPVLDAGAGPRLARCQQGTWVADKPADNTTGSAQGTGAAALQGPWLDGKVDIVARQVDIKTLFARLHRPPEVEFRIRITPSRRVSLEMKDVSTRQFLETLAAREGLAYTQEGDVIFVDGRGEAR
jgi:beta-lactamase regulating signal transducer with metallopeptidase domain